jgi:ABC-type glycerol-3-phosphate transport system permease component
MAVETSRVLLGLVFLVVGIALFAGAIVTRLRMEKEVIGHRRVLPNSHFPCWNSDNFSDKGNSLRKIYNVIYFALIAYSIALIIFMKAGN